MRISGIRQKMFAVVGEYAKIKGTEAGFEIFLNFGWKLSSFSILGGFRQEISTMGRSFGLDSHFFSKWKLNMISWKK